jgi:hypothetical protein
MSKNGIPSTMPDTTPIYRLIRQTRTLLRSTWVITGLGLTTGLLLATLVLVTLTDLVVPLLPGLRLVGLLLVMIPAAWAFFVGVVRPLFRRLGPGHVARRIEAHLPGIHNRLVSCIDLEKTHEPEASATGTGRYSPAFYRRLLTEAIERIRGFRPGKVVDYLSLRRAGVFAFAAGLAFVLALTIFSDRLPRAMARIFQPFADLPPKTGVEYTVEPGTTKVLRGDDIPFAVHVTRGEPKTLRLELEASATGRGASHLSYDVQKQENGVSQITLNSGHIGEGFENAFTYRVYGGGTWSPQYSVTIVDRPKIVELHTVLHYPEYMAMPEPRVGPPQTAEVTGPEGSAVEVVVEAEGNVKEGEIQLLEPRVQRVTGDGQKERVWFEDKIPAGSLPEGTWQWDLPAHQRHTHTEPAAAGTHGHWFQGASAGFQVHKGENLFTYVFIVPGQVPDTLMLQWHDGTGWEHRAYWGLDKIKLGKADSPGHRRMGPLPEAGKWVRLEVPAELVDLQGKVVRGMSFNLCDGQCFWHRAGAVQVEQRVLTPVATFAMHALPAEAGGPSDNTWSGRFPLHGTGLYRVELRNELGYANKTMKEARFVSIPDNPPQIILERPGTDLVLSAPSRVPLVLSAYDDFGLADISLVVQRGDKGVPETQVLKHYDKPQRSDNLVAAFDLAAMQVKLGEFVRYHAEARDRKGQVAKTQDFVIRLAVDQNAADQQLEAFEKSQDPFREKLIKLIGEQAKVRDAVEKLAAKYAPLNEKVQAAQREAQAKADAEAKASPTAPKPAGATPPLKLDPEGERALQELRKELAELAKQEAQNVQLGAQVAGDLQNIADQGTKLQMLPPEVAKQLQELQQAFQQLGLQPLQNLAAQMNRGADSKQGDPQVPDMKRRADRLQKDLEAMKARMQALEEVQKKLRDDPDQALAKLKQEMLKQKGGLTARDLQDLRDFIAALRQQLKEQEGTQDRMRNQTGRAPDKDLSDLEKQQENLDKRSDKLLDDTKELQASDKMKRMKKRRKPSFPESPYDPDSDERMVAPREEDTDEAPMKDDKTAAKEGAKDAKDKTKAGKKDDDEDEDLFMPALGGNEKVDPRLAKKQRPVARKPKKGDTPGGRRENLQAHQADKMDALNRAEDSLAADELTLEQMLNQLQQAMRSPGARRQPGQQQEGNDQGQQDLAQMLKSEALQQALAMVNRMDNVRQGQKGSRPPNTTLNQAPIGNLQGSPHPGAPLEGELSKLDLDTRKALFRMQPKLREELLQSMREEGPEGYRKFIEEYFKRLTEVPGSK